MSLVRNAILTLALAGCSGQLDNPTPSSPTPPPATADAGASTTVDVSPIVAGVPDRGRDPAVVAVSVEQTRVCSGTVIASNVVLTSKSCVTIVNDVSCPSDGHQVASHLEPASLAILAGDDVTSASVVAHGLEVVTTESSFICDHDIAAIILDTNLDIAPIKLSKVIPEVGKPLRTVGFDTNGTKLLREYVRIVALSSSEFEVGEATCDGDFGGPALDDTSGQLMGVMARSGSVCDGEGVHNVYTRTDVYLTLVESALAEGVAQGGVTIKAAGKPDSDMGASCTQATDCSTGVCVEASYCSHACDSLDRCPTGFKCTAAAGDKFCFEK
jgi:hypothetical protein